MHTVELTRAGRETRVAAHDAFAEGNRSLASA
jgi:hypothetical protein